MSVNTMQRTTSGVALPPAVADEIWAEAEHQSVVMQRFPKTSLPANGKEIQVIVGEPAAKFVAEGKRKPAGEHTLGKRTMRAYKIALTESFSDEFRRDKTTLYNALKPRLGAALAKTFDQAVLTGQGAPTGDFDTLAGAPKVSINGAGKVYAGLVEALKQVADAKGNLDNWLISPQAEAMLLSEVDGVKRPLFTMNPQTDGSIGQLLGRPVTRTREVYQAKTSSTDEILGVAGDFTSAMWGMVGAISYEEYGGPVFDDNKQLIHAGRQDNLFTVIAEVEVGFIVRDVNRFVTLTGATKGTA